MTLLAVVIGAPTAGAGKSCPSRTLTNPFVPWGDFGNYAFVPNGGFENRGTHWNLANGARVVDGNEPFYVHSVWDASSLSLPAGAVASTDGQCVEHVDRTMRFFAVTDGLGSTLKVEYGVASGTQIAWHEVAVLSGTTIWEPTAILPLPQIATATSKSTVWFRFTAQGTSGTWRIDDIYVDPFLNK